MNPENAVDIVIMTALREERDAVLGYVDKTEAQSTKGRLFYRASVGPYSAIILCVDEMGNAAAGVATQQAISVWNPAHIILTGIAGGLQKGDARFLGDVLIAEQVVGYELAKQGPKGIERRYQGYRPAKVLLEAARLVTPEEWALRIKARRPDRTTGRVVPAVHFGVVMSGEKVVTDPTLTTALNEDWAQMIGVEMEGFGTALAAYKAENAPGFLMVKGISDWADPEKADNWRGYAAEAAAAYVRALLDRQPFDARTSRPQAVRLGAEGKFDGKTKIAICRKLHDDWHDLADYFDIPKHNLVRFEKGREPQGIWGWLEDRDKLSELRAALEFVGREDLIANLPTE